MVDDFGEERAAIVPLPKVVLIDTVWEKVIFGNGVETRFLVDESHSERLGRPKN